MAIKRGDKWYCSYCQKHHSDQAKADSCRDSHELIYVPLTKTQLNKLLQFIFTKEESLLTDDLMQTLTRYLRGN